MKPTRIRAEGFSAYRSAVELDLSEIDFFSLAGATGAGKSSLVDAMIFALYGRVPRLGGNAVAPAISAGADRARIALDFEVDGEPYTVVRMAMRTKAGGASVREARLQAGEQVLADGADDVTDAVEDLLRLRFEDFVRTVVLPQGEFARFLTATRAERQSLLRNLLGLDVYSRVRSLAKTRRSVASDRADVARARLEALDVPSEKECAAAQGRLEELESLASSIVEDEAVLTELRTAARSDAEEVTRLEDLLAQLSNIEVPPRLEELDHLVAEARGSVDEVVARLTSAGDVAENLEQERQRMPSRETLAAWGDTRGRLTDVLKRIEDLDVEGGRALVADADQELVQARSRLTDAEAAHESARASHAAHSIRETLVVGEPCPVCHREVEELVSAPVPEEIEVLDRAKLEASEGMKRAGEVFDSARTELTRRETTYAELDRQAKSLQAQLADAPDREEMSDLVTRLAELERRQADSRGEISALEDELKRRRRTLEELSESIRSVGRTLMAARQAVSPLSPPLPESDDVIVQWKEFLLWREEATERLAGDLLAATERSRAAAARAEESRAELVRRLGIVGVPAAEPFAVEVARELQIARSTVDSQVSALADQRELAEQIEISNAESAVAAALTRHLRADGFEQWLMVGAMADLVSGANGLLSQLSEGGYSLQADDDGSFSIIDHRNADQVRLVSTLSGGETFLVSLALALSLAETLAASGGARLEAIILDEGFGTLDDESLDTVASVLEELAGEGLMVGVITHVKELASRAPVRFEVVRGSAGARVELAS